MHYRLFLVMTFFLVSFNIQSKNLIRVKTLGKSPKGQFIAFEEFGFTNDSKTPFAKIKVMNVWKNKYVIKTIHVTDPKKKMKLNQIRAKAKKLANKQLKVFNIST